jgi:hypothetical protein
MESIWFSQLDHRYEAVTLSYGAVYGPDIDDVAEWQDKCVAVVDDKT